MPFRTYLAAVALVIPLAGCATTTKLPETPQVDYAQNADFRTFLVRSHHFQRVLWCEAQTDQKTARGPGV